MPVDPAAMHEVMKSAGFTRRQSELAVRSVDYPWTAVAADMILNNLSRGGPSYIENLLESRGFDEKTRRAAKDIVDYQYVNWKMRAHEMLVKYLERQLLTPGEIRLLMLRRGHSEASVEYAFAHTLIPDDADWDARSVETIREVLNEQHYSRRELTTRLRNEGMDEERMRTVLRKVRPSWMRCAEHAALEILHERGHESSWDDVAQQLQRRGFTRKQIETAIDRARSSFDDMV